MNDYTERREAFLVKEQATMSPDGKYMWVDFDGNLRLELSCFTNDMKLYGHRACIIVHFFTSKLLVTNKLK